MNIHNTNTAIAALAAAKYSESSSWIPAPLHDVDVDIVPGFKEPHARTGTASTSDRWGMSYALPMLITAATFAAFDPMPVSASFNWKTAVKPAIAQDRRDRSGSRQFAEATIADQVVLELSKLIDGWAGAGTLAPSKKTIDEITAVLDLLPKKIAMPSIEVEEDDGMVSLRWLAVNKQRSFSLTCRGTGRVTGVVSTVDPPRSKPWSAAVCDDVKIAMHLEEQIASGIFAG